jgi:RHS repeat-associated protein
VYDGEKVAEEHDYSGANQATYTHAGSSIYSPLLAQRTDSASAWFLQDALGSTLGLLNANEGFALSAQYDAWGNVLAQLAVSGVSTPYRYVGAYGYYRDTESDLLYLWMRYYDPTTGRFVRRDPLHMPYTPYGYVGAEPPDYVDPEGLWPRRRKGPPGRTLPIRGKIGRGVGRIGRKIGRIGKAVQDPIGEVIEFLCKRWRITGAWGAAAITWVVEKWLFPPPQYGFGPADCYREHDESFKDYCARCCRINAESGRYGPFPHESANPEEAAYPDEEALPSSQASHWLEVCLLNCEDGQWIM